VLLDRATEVGDAVMPGRTHYQLAQPVLVGHYLMAHAWPLVRDIGRFDDFLVRNDVSPYGGGALAGGGMGLDPEAISRALGFSAVSPNSLDGDSRKGFLRRGRTKVRSLHLKPRVEVAGKQFLIPGQKIGGHRGHLVFSLHHNGRKLCVKTQNMAEKIEVTVVGSRNEQNLHAKPAPPRQGLPTCPREVARLLPKP